MPLINGLNIAEDDFILSTAEVFRHRNAAVRVSHEAQVAVDEVAEVADIVSLRVDQFPNHEISLRQRLGL